MFPLCEDSKKPSSFKLLTISIYFLKWCQIYIFFILGKEKLPFTRVFSTCLMCCKKYLEILLLNVIGMVQVYKTKSMPICNKVEEF